MKPSCPACQDQQESGGNGGPGLEASQGRPRARDRRPKGADEGSEEIQEHLRFWPPEFTPWINTLHPILSIPGRGAHWLQTEAVSSAPWTTRSLGSFADSSYHLHGLTVWSSLRHLLVSVPMEINHHKYEAIRSARMAFIET